MLRLFLAGLLSVLALPQGPEMRAGQPDRVDRQLGNDRFTAGQAVTVVSPVAGDLIAAGGSVDVDTEVAGDVVVAGGTVRLAGDLGQSVYAAGGRLFLDGAVNRNVRVGGGDVEIAPKADIGGSVTVCAGQVTIKGAVKGYVQAYGSRVFIDGPVGGDVEASSGNVELGPNARISGMLRYTSKADVKRHPAAQIAGGVRHITPPACWPLCAESAAGFGAWIWTIGLMVLAATLVALLPQFYARVGNTVESHLGLSLLSGFVALICIPAAAVILLITVVGIPLALLTIVLFLALLLVGYVTTSVVLGDWALKTLKPEKSGNSFWRSGAATLAMLFIALFTSVPWIGGLVVLLALILGFGALVLQLKPLTPQLH